MTKQEIRETELYGQHFGCNEPENHYQISIYYAIHVVEKWRDKLIKDNDMPPNSYLGRKTAELINDLKKQLISS